MPELREDERADRPDDRMEEEPRVDALGVDLDREPLREEERLEMEPLLR
jgi:hypothetical protein